MSKDIETIQSVLEDVLLYEPCRDYSCRGACHQAKLDQASESIQKIIERDVIGEDISLDEARHMQRVVRDETNGTRHALNPNAVAEALAVNTKLTMQRQALTNALYGKGEYKE